MVEGEIFPWLNANDAPMGDFQIHAALHPAIAAVRRHKAVNLLIRFPVRWRTIGARMKIECLWLIAPAPAKYPFIYGHLPISFSMYNAYRGRQNHKN
jgi:hypothetical protein